MTVLKPFSKQTQVICFQFYMRLRLLTISNDISDDRNWQIYDTPPNGKICLDPNGPYWFSSTGGRRYYYTVSRIDLSMGTNHLYTCDLHHTSWSSENNLIMHHRYGEGSLFKMYQNISPPASAPPVCAFLRIKDVQTCVFGKRRWRR